MIVGLTMHCDYWKTITYYPTPESIFYNNQYKAQTGMMEIVLLQANTNVKMKYMYCQKAIIFYLQTRYTSERMSVTLTYMIVY